MNIVCHSEAQNSGNGAGIDSNALQRERDEMARHRSHWEEEKRELCGRIADLELEVANLIAASSNALAAGMLEEEAEEEGLGPVPTDSIFDDTKERTIGELVARYYSLCN